ncbi:lanthionine synthetase C family protein [Streptomyces pinistramenti]|uniref:lanthionine synthetase C family protein n=1 Tax=Streptomyces pinistramenti TaxID=2884812 RepID=UPI001D060B9F|nr:lanthionine synthetase C family protein [Streptomyces pinistramenti]MCB5908453.1 lanthionine synthetase C family protein [Streptomyces pinistramenti]
MSSTAMGALDVVYPPGTEDSRKDAARIVTELATRLSDPAAVLAITTAPDNLEQVPGEPPRSPWGRAGLGEGNAAVAMLFAELGHIDTRHRTHAHAHLSAAAAGVGSFAEEGLFYGAPAVAFAARMAQHTSTDYARLLHDLDQQVTARLNTRLTLENRRLDAGIPGADVRRYDVINGLTGYGRYLLLQAPQHRRLLTDVLTYLVRLTKPVTAQGHTVPGWWLPRPPDSPDTPFPHGHFNLGLAHGIPGPLALLALAKQRGIEVPGHDTAINDIVEWTLAWRRHDDHWPTEISFEQQIEPDTTTSLPDRTAWCYGTPGVARALYLAGTALDRPDWRQTAVDSLIAVIDNPLHVHDQAICHGWAGLLHIAWRTARDSGDPHLAARLPRLASPILAAYDDAHPLGFLHSSPYTDLAPHRAGLLDGAAGIALALHAYATNTSPATPWDAALLLT